MFKIIIMEVSHNYIKIALRNKDKLYFCCTHNINNSDDIKDILEKFINENEIKTKRIVIILREEKIYKRFKSFPYMSEKELKDLINNNLNDFFPVNKEDYVIDYETNLDLNTINAFVVAVEKKIINKYLDIIDVLNLTCVSIDFYQNCIGKRIADKFQGKTIVIHEIKEKYSFIYMDRGKIINIRDILLDFSKDIKITINKNFGFFENELFELKNIILLDDIPEIEMIFEKFNLVNKNNLQLFFEENIDFLAFRKVFK